MKLFLYIFSEFPFKNGRFVSKISITIPYSIIRAIKSTRMRWVGHVARMGERRSTYRVLVGKPEGKGPFERPGRR